VIAAAIGLLASLLRHVAELVRDLAPRSANHRRDGDQARGDDILDASLDEDGMDASGL
jgi:hypothetical protein